MFDKDLNSEEIDLFFNKKKEESNKVKENNSTFDLKKYLDVKLKGDEKERLVRVRLLNSDKNSKIPFQQVYFHNIKVPQDIHKSGYKKFVCLSSKRNPNLPENKISEKCPLCEEGKKINLESSKLDDNDPRKKELFNKGLSYLPKLAYVVRVIDRDKEDEGVKFWTFNDNSKGQGVFDKLKSLYEMRKNEMKLMQGIENYSIFNFKDGKDLTLSLTETFDKSGKRSTALNINDVSFTSPLSNDEEKVKQWVEDPTMWYDVYTPKTKRYLEIVAEGGIPYFDESEGDYKPFIKR